MLFPFYILTVLYKLFLHKIKIKTIPPAVTNIMNITVHYQQYEHRTTFFNTFPSNYEWECSQLFSSFSDLFDMKVWNRNCTKIHLFEETNSNAVKGGSVHTSYLYTYILRRTPIQLHPS